MQCRNERGDPAEDLFGQVGADGMRDRIVDMQHVQPLVHRDLGHFRGQGQRVGWIGVEERVRRDRHLMKAHPLMHDVEARWQRIADEMDVVASLRQRDTQLRGHDS